MVKELLTADKIQMLDSVMDWQDAVRQAAAPLLLDGSVTTKYVDAMIESVQKNGPYIVLADGFALPHAQGEGEVSRVALALLQVTQPVDLLGKPVHAFLVLATPDNRSHIQTLAQLMELLYDPDNLELLCSGTKEQVLGMISTI